MSADPNAAEPSEAVKIADQAYFDLLRRELQQRGQPQAAPYLREQLKLLLDREQAMGANTLVKFKVAHRVTEYSTRLNAVTGNTISWYMDFLAKGGDRATPPDMAQKMVEEVVEPPEDAQLVCSDYDSTSGRTVYRARWAHVIDELPVEGDYLEVLFNGKAQKIFSYARVWRKPHLSKTPAER